MDIRKHTWWAFVVLALLIFSLMLWNTRRGTAHVMLPGTEETGSSSSDDLTNSTLQIVEITPGTVQSAIAVLSRPYTYRRSASITQYWPEGSGSYIVNTAVSGNWTRSDCILSNQRTRSSITNGTISYIWYDNSTDVYEVRAGDISADNEQNIPTYEDILTFPAEDITAADYRSLSGVNCIFAEIKQPDGYAIRYWVSISTGLLVSAEKLFNEKVVYHMEAFTLDKELPSTKDFTLPNGTVVTG